MRTPTASRRFPSALLLLALAAPACKTLPADHGSETRSATSEGSAGKELLNLEVPRVLSAFTAKELCSCYYVTMKVRPDTPAADKSAAWRHCEVFAKQSADIFGPLGLEATSEPVTKGQELGIRSVVKGRATGLETFASVARYHGERNKGCRLAEE